MPILDGATKLPFQVNIITIDDEEKAEKLLKLIDALEESDDVQKVFGNYELSEEIFNKLSN